MFLAIGGFKTQPKHALTPVFPSRLPYASILAVKLANFGEKRAS